MDSQMKQEVFEANLLLSKQGLVLFTWGNVSAVNRENGQVIIKPSGVSYEKMKVEDLVIVDMDGNIISGSYKPSSDLETHLELYRNFPECQAVVHTHSTMATAWAQAGMDLPAFGTTHADYFYGAIPCTRALTDVEIEGAYEQETGRVIVETFKMRNIDPMAVQGVLVNGHGPFTWGAGPMDAVNNTIVLEEIAVMASGSVTLNPKLHGISQQLLDKHYLRKHGEDAYYGQT